MLLDNIKKSLGATSPGVRTAGVTLIGTLYLYNNGIISLFDDQKPTIKSQIDAEIEKYINQKPPRPTRGSITKSASKQSLEEDDSQDNSQASDAPKSDNTPKVDVSNQITEALLNELNDKNWKVRIEGLTKIMNIINENKSISNIGDLPIALAPRLVDANSRIAQTTLQVCEALGKAMEGHAKPHVRTLLPNILQGLGDSKTWIRQAAMSCMNTWGDCVGYKEFFDNEMIADALKTGSPTLRIELWLWIAEKLPGVKPKTIAKEELCCCVPYLYSNLEDRNADVRKNAQEAVLAIMLHLGYESMLKQSEKFKVCILYTFMILKPHPTYFLPETFLVQ